LSLIICFGPYISFLALRVLVLPAGVLFVFPRQYLGSIIDT
jgi:hypothetical protein